MYNEWWDGVTLWDVLEHIFLPEVFLRHLKSKYVFIATPLVAEGVTDLTGWKHYKPNEHQHYFTISSLVWMMKRSGYIIQEVNFTEGALRDPEHPQNIITIVGRRE